MAQVGYCFGMKPEYPLGAVEALRSARAEQRERALLDARQRLLLAESELEQARRQVESARAAQAELERRERTALEAGSARVADLQLASAYAQGERARRHALLSDVASAERRAAEAERLADTARQSAVAARAELLGIERHREAWQVERARQEQDQAEEAANEAWSVGRFGSAPR